MFKRLKQMICKTKSTDSAILKAKSETCPNCGEYCAGKTIFCTPHIWSPHIQDVYEKGSVFLHQSKMWQLKQKLYKMIGWRPEPTATDTVKIKNPPLYSYGPFIYDEREAGCECARCGCPAYSLYQTEHGEWYCFPCQPYENDYVIWGMYG